MMDARSKIHDFLHGFLRSDVGDDEDIFATGFVNSLLVMQLVTMVEREFNITVEDDDLDFANFNTVDAIIGFVERKRTLLPAASGHGGTT